MRNLTPAEELAFLKEIYGSTTVEGIVASLRDSFNVLQARAQLLLSLIAICLTITGFSGRQIAASGVLARIFIGAGVLAVLVAAVILFTGPLLVQWITAYRAESLDHTLIQLIERRNQRTARYHAAVISLLIGLTGYVLSIVAYLLTT